MSPLPGGDAGRHQLQRVKRHPTLMDGVVVGAGAIILGAVTVGRRLASGGGRRRPGRPGRRHRGGLSGGSSTHRAPHPAMD